MPLLPPSLLLSPGLSHLLSLHVALELLEVLLPWRHSAEEALATQIEVFEDSHQSDLGQLDMPGGVDINSHGDVFNAVFGKVGET